MPQWAFSRNVTSMRLMAELAADHGVSIPDSLAGTRVKERQLADPEQAVTADQELRLIRNIVERLDHVPALGIDAGARYHFTAFGVLGFALVSSRTLRSALDVALQYFHLTFAFTRFLLEETDFETCVVLDDAEVPEEVARFVVERDVTALVTVTRDLYTLGPILRALRFRHLPSADLALYQKRFGLKPGFGCDRNVAVLDRSQMERPLPQANELTFQAAIDQCRRLIESRKARRGLASMVRDRMLPVSAKMPTMEVVADDLCMTARTLRRHLLDEGTTFAELRDEVRLTLADEFLTGPRLSIEQITDRLGYAETTSFINAFKRWRGCTPHAFRLKGQKG
jgi:AraC-like DNA-binding protein